MEEEEETGGGFVVATAGGRGARTAGSVLCSAWGGGGWICGDFTTVMVLGVEVLGLGWCGVGCEGAIAGVDPSVVPTAAGLGRKGTTTGAGGPVIASLFLVPSSGFCGGGFGANGFMRRGGEVTAGARVSAVEVGCSSNSFRPTFSSLVGWGCGVAEFGSRIEASSGVE